jgi:hypothetical protein
MLFFQANKEKEQSTKSRCMTILMSITATYVIGDLYCANLTSLLAKPGRGALIITTLARDFSHALICYRTAFEKFI